LGRGARAGRKKRSREKKRKRRKKKKKKLRDRRINAAGGIKGRKLEVSPETKGDRQKGEGRKKEKERATTPAHGARQMPTSTPAWGKKMKEKKKKGERANYCLNIVKANISR